MTATPASENSSLASALRARYPRADDAHIAFLVRDAEIAKMRPPVVRHARRAYEAYVYQRDRKIAVAWVDLSVEMQDCWIAAADRARASR